MVGLRRANQASGNGQARLVGDHRGSTTLLLDTSTPPAVVQRQHYTPYGESAYRSAPPSGSLTSMDFTGQRRDADTGLLYYGARFYDPALAYFVSADTASPDPMVSQSRNRYSYVVNNPLRHIDPSGYGPEYLYSVRQG